MEHSTGQLLKPKEVIALLGIGKTTFYTLTFFKRRKVTVTKGRRGIRYRLADVLLFQSGQMEDAA